MMYEDLTDKECVKLFKKKYPKNNALISQKMISDNDTGYYSDTNWIHIREVLELLKETEVSK